MHRFELLLRTSYLLGPCMGFIFGDATRCDASAMRGRQKGQAGRSTGRSRASTASPDASNELRLGGHASINVGRMSPTSLKDAVASFPEPLVLPTDPHAFARLDLRSLTNLTRLAEIFSEQW